MPSALHAKAYQAYARCMATIEQYCQRHFNGVPTRMARAFGLSQSFLRRCMLPVGHPQRSGIGEKTVHLLYRMSGGEIQPNDLFLPLPPIAAKTSAKRRRRGGVPPPKNDSPRAPARGHALPAPARTRGGSHGMGRRLHPA